MYVDVMLDYEMELCCDVMSCIILVYGPDLEH